MFSAPIRPGFEMRLLEERHAPALFQVVDREREQLREWLPWVDATRTEDDTLSFIRSALEQFASNSGVVAGIWGPGGIAGVVGMQKIDWLNRNVELGYWLSTPFRGSGLMTDACRTMISYAFAELDLHRVSIRCGVRNVTSCAIPERLGFTPEGTLREAQLLNGRYEDLRVFAMLKRDWKR
jgi:ribosomal-protein-serine acetyltransferase